MAFSAPLWEIASAAVIAPDYDGTHLSDAVYPFDLMTAFQSRGQRLLPSDLDFAILSDAFGYTLNVDTCPNLFRSPASVLRSRYVLRASFSKRGTGPLLAWRSCVGPLRPRLLKGDAS